MMITTQAVLFLSLVVMVIGKLQVFDLSYTYDNDTIYWPPEQKDGSFRVIHTISNGDGTNKDYYELNRFCTAEHGGTHLDAPRHFAPGTTGMSDIPLDKLIGPAFIIDVSSDAARNKDLLILQAHFEAAEKALGRTVDGCIVLLYTGWSQRWPDKNTYLGTNTTNTSILHFPGLHPNAAKWLIQRRKIKTIGIDTASIDYGQSKDFATHRILFSAEIPVIENLNMKSYDQYKHLNGLMIYALPMKIKDGSGAPLRIVASHDDGSVGSQNSRSTSIRLILNMFVLVACLSIDAHLFS